MQLLRAVFWGCSLVLLGYVLKIKEHKNVSGLGELCERMLSARSERGQINKSAPFFLLNNYLETNCPPAITMLSARLSPSNRSNEQYFASLNSRL